MQLIALALLIAPLDVELGKIDEMRRATLESRDAFRQIEIPNSEQSSEGASAVAFLSEEGDLRLIEWDVFGHAGKVHYEFYYSNLEPYLVMRVDRQYNAPIYVDKELAEELNAEPFDPEKTKQYEYQFYVVDGKIIHSKEDEPYKDLYGYLVDPDGKEVLAIASTARRQFQTVND